MQTSGLTWMLIGWAGSDVTRPPSYHKPLRRVLLKEQAAAEEAGGGVRGWGQVGDAHRRTRVTDVSPRSPSVREGLGTPLGPQVGVTQATVAHVYRRKRGGAAGGGGRADTHLPTHPPSRWGDRRCTARRVRACNVCDAAGVRTGAPRTGRTRTQCVQHPRCAHAHPARTPPQHAQQPRLVHAHPCTAHTSRRTHAGTTYPTPAAHTHRTCTRTTCTTPTPRPPTPCMHVDNAHNTCAAHNSVYTTYRQTPTACAHRARSVHTCSVGNTRAAHTHGVRARTQHG